MGGPGSGRRRDKARDREVAELRDRGLTLAEIGHRFGITRQGVKLVLDRQGYGGPPKCRWRRAPAADPDRVKLLFGPYQAPPLKRGDRAVCLFRDCEVVITTWSDAPIPWPRCHALDSPGPGSGLLVDEELARAVRHESALAIRHWWGASWTAVRNWRRALGVRGLDTEGSRELHRKVSHEGGAAVRHKFAPRPQRPPPPERKRAWAAGEDELVPMRHGVGAARRARQR
jgi:hypothetical protein